jgi:hypothetical protein
VILYEKNYIKELFENVKYCVNDFVSFSCHVFFTRKICAMPAKRGIIFSGFEISNKSFYDSLSIHKEE